ncbi:MAG: hypothetical protein SGPRY_012739 [Prymnesium sp.]
MNHLPLIVPDDCPTLAAAIRLSRGRQRVRLRAGEHLVASLRQDDPGSSRLFVDRPIHLSGEKGARIRGSLVLRASGRCRGGGGGEGDREGEGGGWRDFGGEEDGGGVIRGLQIEDGGDCCIRCEGGLWQFEELNLLCSHSAALHVCREAQVEMRECTLGGEGSGAKPASPSQPKVRRSHPG